MPKSKTLTPKQAAFARAYLETGNATEAYRRTYASKASREVVKAKAHVVRHHPLVAAEIDRLHRLAVEESIIKTEAITRQYARVAFADIRDFVESTADDLRFKPESEWPAGAAARIKSVKKKVTRREDGTTTIERSIELLDPTPSLNAIGKHRGYFAADNKQSTPQAGPGGPDAELLAHLQALTPAQRLIAFRRFRGQLEDKPQGEENP